MCEFGFSSGTYPMLLCLWPKLRQQRWIKLHRVPALFEPPYYSCLSQVLIIRETFQSVGTVLKDIIVIVANFVCDFESVYQYPLSVQVSCQMSRICEMMKDLYTTLGVHWVPYQQNGYTSELSTI